MNKDPPKSLFVTNLPYSLDLENFKSYFTKFGPVERFDIPDHPNKPIAFVHFQNAEDAARCLKENDGILYQGKILCIKFSSKAKPDHAPPLPASVKTDSSESSSTKNNKPDNENFSRKRRHDNLYNDFDRRRNPSPDYEMDRRRDLYYRDRIYRDRLPREPNIHDRDPPYYHDRDPDYYYDDYPRDYHGYHRHRRPANDHRDREIIQSYPERDLRDQRERDYYDYDYNNPARYQSQPLQPRQIPQSQLQQNLPYAVPQNPQIVNSQTPTNSNQNPPLQLDQMNEMMQIDPRSQMIRSSQLPPPLPPPPPPPLPPPPARILPPPSSSIPQPQQQYEYNDNRYYTTYQ